MKAYKGFNKDMTCRDFQYEEGKEYVTTEAKLCNSGFHACEYPLDCFSYYAPGASVYHEVELNDVSDERESDDTKICAKRIKIGAALDIKGLIKAAFEYTEDWLEKGFSVNPFSLPLQSGVYIYNIPMFLHPSSLSAHNVSTSAYVLWA